MDVCQLRENEILATAQRVKYRRVEYNEGYVTIEQNRTRRRVPDGYHFEDNGVEIYVSTFYSHIFQHQAKIRRFIVNKVTRSGETSSLCRSSIIYPKELNLSRTT